MVSVGRIVLKNLCPNNFAADNLLVGSFSRQRETNSQKVGEKVFVGTDSKRGSSSEGGSFLSINTKTDPGLC